MMALIRTTPAVAAVGEVGLDYTPHVLRTSPLETEQNAREAQRDVFAKFLQLAGELQLPTTAHSRGAGRHALEVVKETAEKGGLHNVVMHAFDGRAVHAERALETCPTGLYFSVPPSVVRDASMRKLVKRLPLERLLLESDAPALGATAGERNEPGRIAGTVRVIAGEKGVSETMVRLAMWEGCMQVFG